MKRRWNRLAAAGMAAVMAAALTGGCGKRATPENLLEDMQKNMDRIESFEGNLAMAVEMSDGTDSLAFHMDIDMGATEDPGAVYGKGNVAMNMSGTNIGTEMELYQVTEDGESVTYVLVDNMWSRTASEDDGMNLGADITGDIGDYAELFEMARSTVDVNGKECFEMTGDIGGEAIAGILGDGLESMTGLSLDEETLADVKIPCTIDIYRESILPARFFIDMSDIIDTIVDVSSAGVSVSECSIEVTYLDFDSLDTIEVPREAVEATEDAGPDSYDDYEENIFGDIDAGADPIEPADSLGRVWETYTVQINDKVLSLPCSIEEMRAAGLEMDTEYTPDNYVVNAGDYELAWFEDADGNSVMADMVNMTSDPMEIRNCQVGGISVYDYDVESGALVVILPGGVQIGTHIDDVLSAYGDADDSYDGDYSNSYYWNGQGDNYYDGCSVDTDPETDRVISMSISHYE